MLIRGCHATDSDGSRIAADRPLFASVKNVPEKAEQLGLELCGV